MPVGRPNKPLFDLLPRDVSDRRSAPAVTPRSSIIEHKPPPTSAALPPDPYAGRPPMSEHGPASPSGAAEPDAYLLPRTWVYIGIAAVSVVLIATWILGVRAGRSDAERRLASQLVQDQSPGPSDPTPIAPPPNRTDPGPVRPNDPKTDNTRPAPPRSTPDAPAPADPTSVGTGRHFVATGWTDADPRQKNLNYLHLPALRRDDALRAVLFLAENRVEAMAVPTETVDRSPSADKNHPLFRVVVLQGITREQYQGDGGVRARLEQTVRAVGQRWRKDHRGASDFSSMTWVKFVGA
ncbi:MAG: hypothetical protein HRU70_05785 [Phycisphaeraceae bacterium]|nr:MAG: hypothetical protein HRU70_05785 [Phycisphaeraceae bacterium]